MARKEYVNGKLRNIPRGIYLDRGYIYVRIYPNGTKYEKSFGSEASPGALDSAIEHLNSLRAKIRAGTFGLEQTAERKTMNWACDVFDKNHAKGKPTEKTFLAFTKSIREILGMKFIDQITYLDIASYRKEREKHVSPSSVNREHVVLITIFNKLREWKRFKIIPAIRLPEENPAALVKKADEDSCIRTRVLSKKEFDIVWEVSPERLRRIILAAANLGLRKKDLKLLNLEKNWNRTKNYFEGTQAKTGKPFSIPVNGVVEELIKDAPWPMLLDFTNFRREFVAARKAAASQGVAHFEFRDLRRTCGTRMLEQNVDIKTISLYLGHAKVNMTDRYLRPKEENKRIASEMLGSIYRPTLSPITSGVISGTEIKDGSEAVRNTI
jgi:integrase